MAKKHTKIVTGRFEKVKTICKFVADGAKKSGLDETAVFHVELACDEACTNIIEHAYGAENVGRIEVSWQVDGDQFTITIHDSGGSFNPNKIPSPLNTIPTNPDDFEDIQVGGLGIHFMRELMDEVKYDFDSKKGNTLIMVKRIPK